MKSVKLKNGFRVEIERYKNKEDARVVRCYFENGKLFDEVITLECCVDEYIEQYSSLPRA